jgi:hypothetical protein
MSSYRRRKIEDLKHEINVGQPLPSDLQDWLYKLTDLVEDLVIENEELKAKVGSVVAVIHGPE